MLKLDEGEKRLLNTIGNESRLKILITLRKSEQELTIYKISRFTGLGRNSVVRHIKNLVGSELVIRKIYGEIPLYTINKNNLKANALIDFFSKIKI